MELSKILQKCSLANTMKQLDWKPFLLWKSEHEESLHYTVERGDEIQKRIIVIKIYIAKKRFISY